jgi:hypothetical protein
MTIISIHRLNLFALAACLLPGLVRTAWGHPGHGVEEGSAMHWLLDPAHFGSLLLALVALVICRFLVSRHAAAVAEPRTR